MVRMSQLDVQEVIEAVFHTEVAASALRDAFACWLAENLLVDWGT